MSRLFTQALLILRSIFFASSIGLSVLLCVVFFLLHIHPVWISDLMVSVTDLSGIILAAFHFSVLGERLHAAMYSSIELLDKQLRETTVINTVKRNHSCFV